ncbi:hypothetical protein BDV93DRAFT_603871 [Ceratobasidium sp. AG-I]|nr:hypothetical protein BDV93DRAFT_603871 [Ceratobasidium sp. AG-I]
MLSMGYTQGSLQHLPALPQGNPMVYGASKWDCLIACRDIGAESKEFMSRNRAEVNGMPSPNHFDDPVNLNDPMFFHPQHPRSVENFDTGEFGFGSPETSLMAEKAHGTSQRLYPAYQLPGLTYEVRPNGSMAVLSRRSYSVSNKRTMDLAPQEEVVSPMPNKKRRLTNIAN